MEIKIKKLHPDATIPKYQKPGDAGMDLYAINYGFDLDHDLISYNTGLAIEIPEGYVGLLFPRSSISKMDLLLSNSVGVIDSGYRGEIICKFKLTYASPLATTYKIGDRIAQLMIVPYPKVTLIEVNELSTTERGTGGFGSTGV